MGAMGILMGVHSGVWTRSIGRVVVRCIEESGQQLDLNVTFCITACHLTSKEIRTYTRGI